MADGVGKPGAHEGGVGHVGLVFVAGIVFGEENGELGPGRCFHLIVHFGRGAANHLRARDRFVREQNVLGLVIAVDMG